MNLASKDTASVIESKIRKTSRASGAAASCPTSTSANSSTSPTNSNSGNNHHRKELRFLTDFYPDQSVEGGPLTRSKTRNVEGPSSSKRTGSSSSARTSNKTSKKNSRKNQSVPVVPTPVEFSIEGHRARSPTPDPSS